MPDEVLSGSMVESLLTALAYAKQDAAPLLAVLEPDMFEGLYGDVAEKIFEYRRRFKEPPAPAHLDDIFDHIGPDHKQYRQYNRILIGMREQAPSLNLRFLIDRVTNFARQQRLKDGVLRAAERYQQGGDTVAEDVEHILSDTLKQRVSSTDLGTRLSVDTLDFLDRSEVDAGMQIRTGIDQLDRFDLMPTRGEVFAFMAARKRGKCVAKGTLIQLADGRRKSIEDVVRDKDRLVICLNEDTKQFEKVTVSDHLFSGEQKCFLLELEGGRSVPLTNTHPVLTPAGWVPVEQLGSGDFVAIPTDLSGLGHDVCEPERARLLGYLIADGGLTNGITFTKYDKVISDNFIHCVEVCGAAVTVGRAEGLYYVVDDGTGIKPSNKVGTPPSNVQTWLSEIGLLGKKSKDKSVPEFVFGLSDELISEFLGALLSCDGNLSLLERRIEYCASSAQLVDDVQYLLIRLGVNSRTYDKSVFKEGKELFGYRRLIISGQRNVLRFLDRVQWLRVGGQLAVQALRGSFKGLVEKQDYGTKKLSDVAMFVKVKRITYRGVQQTYDLSVPKHHNFLANDIIIHNSWMLQFLGKQAARQRWNVVHISLENREPRVKARYVQTALAVAKREDEFVQSFFRKDSRGLLDDLEYDVMKPTLAFNRPADRPALNRAVRRHQATFNRIIIKEFASGTLTVQTLDNWLDALEGETGFIPDMLILDYPQLMKLNPRDLRGSFGQVTVDLRGLAGRRQVALCTAMQGNRMAENAKLLRSEHAAEDISQIATADVVLTYNQTEAERAVGLARLHVAAARNDVDRFSILISQAYATGQFQLDSVMMGSSYAEMLGEVSRAVLRETGDKHPDDD